LVITLVLMVLLSILVVGLVQLSSISLRSSARLDAKQTAKNNALLALEMAIGQLQRTAGPDQRITAPLSLAGSRNEGAPSDVHDGTRADGPPMALCHRSRGH
jgi:type II secretory pathway pseudopilin PulG